MTTSSLEPSEALVEKVARAIHDTEWAPEDFVDGWAAAADYERFEYKRMAQAAIAAMQSAASPVGDEVRECRLLRALAIDCENTDGWEDAAPDLRRAADLLSPDGKDAR